MIKKKKKGGASGGGGSSEPSAGLIFPLTWLALAGMAGGALSRLGGRNPVHGGRLLLVLPAWSGLGLFQGNNNFAAFNGCPELVVGAALLAAVLAALAAHERGGGWWVLAGLSTLPPGLQVLALARSPGALFPDRYRSCPACSSR